MFSVVLSLLLLPTGGPTKYQTALITVLVGKWFAEEERKLSDAVYRLSGASPGEFFSLHSVSWSDHEKPIAKVLTVFVLHAGILYVLRSSSFSEALKSHQCPVRDKFCLEFLYAFSLIISCFVGHYH